MLYLDVRTMETTGGGRVSENKRRNVTALRARVQKLEALLSEKDSFIRDIQAVMFAWQVRKTPIQFCEVRALDKGHWQDAPEEGPVWDWVNYTYRVKQQEAGE